MPRPAMEWRRIAGSANVWCRHPIHGLGKFAALLGISVDTLQNGSRAAVSRRAQRKCCSGSPRHIPMSFSR
jgi:hypothetical protein